jgi:hypothetical protein
MVSNSKMEIEKFNGKFFELWKLNMEDLLVEKEQWITVDPSTTPTGTSTDDWKKFDRKAKSTICLSLRLCREIVFFLEKHVAFLPHFSCPLLGGFSAHGFCRWFSIFG